MVQTSVVARKLELIDAGPDLAAEIHQFYVQLNDPNILPRPEDELRVACEQGLFFVVKDGSAIVGVTGVFGLAPHYVELGATGVAVPMRGYRMQRLLGLVRIAGVVAHEGVGTQLTTAIKPTNAPSLRNMSALGFTTWTSPIPEMIAPCTNCNTKPASSSNRVCCCDFLVLPPSEKQRHVRQFLAEVQHTGSLYKLVNNANDELQVEMNTIIASDPHRLDLIAYASSSTP